ncbi:hypothetical protein Ancab_028311 [Ancistrocladus abbreviatus]
MHQRRKHSSSDEELATSGEEVVPCSFYSKSLAASICFGERNGTATIPPRQQVSVGQEHFSESEVGLAGDSKGHEGQNRINEAAGVLGLKDNIRGPIQELEMNQNPVVSSAQNQNPIERPIESPY